MKRPRKYRITPKYNLGGQTDGSSNLGQVVQQTSPLLSLIPGIGSLLSPLINQIGEGMQPNQEQINPIKNQPVSNRNLWNFAKGGYTDKQKRIGDEIVIDEITRQPYDLGIERSNYRNYKTWLRQANKAANQLGMTLDEYYNKYPDEESFKKDFPEIDSVVFAYGGNPNKSYEAEGKEMINHPEDMPKMMNGNLKQMSNSMSEIKGPSHEMGGVNMSGGERIYSDRLKMPGMKKTYAQHAKMLSKKLGKLEKGDTISKRTAEQYKEKLEELFNNQEEMKETQMQEHSENFAKGGKVNFKSKGDYKKWLAYGHATGVFKTPGNQKVSIRGKKVNVKHDLGGYLYEKYADGGVIGKDGLPIDMQFSQTPASPYSQGTYGEFQLNNLYDQFINRSTGTSDIYSQGNMQPVNPMSTQIPVNISGLGNRNLGSPEYNPPDWRSFIGTGSQDMPDGLDRPNLNFNNAEEDRFKNLPEDIGNQSIYSPMQRVQSGLMSNGVPQLNQRNQVNSINNLNRNNLGYNAALYSPIGYNFLQGLISGTSKPDYYKRVQNKQLNKSLGEIDASKDYDISDILAGNRQGYSSMLNQARTASQGSGGNYMAYSLAANRAKRRADTETYGQRNRFKSDANARAASLRYNIGEQERQEDRFTQQNRMQTDANKRNLMSQYISKGFEGLSRGVQANRLMNNQDTMNKWLFDLYPQMYPELSNYGLKYPNQR